MLGWGSFLLALAGPLAKQVLIALGLSIVTYVGVDLAVSNVLAQARANWSGALVGDAAQLIAMAGVNTALSIIAGGIVGRISMMALKRLMPT